MANQIFRKFNPSAPIPTLAFSVLHRTKLTSAHYVALRARDPTFEKLMDKYKNLLKIISIQDLILASQSKPPCVSLDFIHRLSQRLQLNRGPAAFLCKYPHIFHIYSHPIKLHPFCTLTPDALKIVRQEAEAINKSLPLAVTRLAKLLSMSLTKKLPLRAIFKVWKELGLPDNFEDSVISNNPEIFSLQPGNEVNTHFLVLNNSEMFKDCLVPAVENWRVVNCCKEECNGDKTELKYGFKQGFPPGMRLMKNFKAKVKKWQSLPYLGPYEEMGLKDMKKMTKNGSMMMEKRAVGIVHEFLSLTVEKLIEVEKISHFRKWFGIDLNMRDLFLDHPGIFYLSTKGKRHTVFLREAYERGCLIDPNPIYEARRKLFGLVLLGRRGLNLDRAGGCSDGHSVNTSDEESEVEEV